MSDWQARAALVEAENGELRERIASLEDALGMMIEIPVGLGCSFTPTEGRMLGMLLARDFIRREAIHVALYQTRSSADDVPDIKIIDVMICKLRAKLRRICDIPIQTKWGEGYFIRPSDKDALRLLLQQRAA